MVDADVRPLRPGDTFGLTYPGNFWSFSAVSRCLLGKVAKATATELLGGSKLHAAYSWLPELTRALLADDTSRPPRRTIKEKELIIE